MSTCVNICVLKIADVKTRVDIQEIQEGNTLWGKGGGRTRVGEAADHDVGLTLSAGERRKDVG